MTELFATSPLHLVMVSAMIGTLIGALATLFLVFVYFEFFPPKFSDLD